MRNPLRARRVGFSWLVLLFVGLLGSGRTSAVSIDQNGDHMSDVWEMIYGANGLDPNGDADGDGVPNGMEAIAGTDPFDPASVPRISLATAAGTNISVTIPGALGKQYTLESADPAVGGGFTNWNAEVSAVARRSSSVTLSVPASGRHRFFRISISDVDSDNDGLTDWEEYQLGLDPLDPNSNGQHDGNGQPINDYAYAIGKLAAQNTITINATDPTANQPDPGQTAQNIGILTVTRAGFPLSGLLVNLGLASGGPGVAVEGVDHVPVYRSVFFPPGSSSQTVTVTPLANTNRISPVVATVQVLPGSGYTVGTSGAGSVVIYPSATATGTGLSAEYYTNSSTTYSSPANFNGTNLVLLRIDPTVDFTWGSTTDPITNSGYYTVRWTGQVQPEFSETYYFDANTDDGVKVWVNDQLIIIRQTCWLCPASRASLPVPQPCDSLLTGPRRC